MASLKSLDEMNSQYKRGRILIALFVFILYFVIGVSYYTSTMKLSVLESFYFCVIIFCTIGYGHYVPENNAQRDFTIFYIIFGMATLGTVVGVVGDQIIDLATTITNKIALEMSVYLRWTRVFWKRRRSQDGSLTANSENSHLSEEARKEEQLELERLREEKLKSVDTELDDLSNRFKLDVATVVVLLGIGTFCMMKIESWNIVDAGYWSVITLCTVGYGDIYPLTNGGRIFTIFYALIGCVFMVKALSNLGMYPVVRKRKREEILLLKKFGEELSESALDNILHNDLLDSIPHLRYKEGEVSKAEFVLLVLRLMGKIDDKDVFLMCGAFDRLDVTQSGVLSNDTLREAMETARAKEAQELEESRKRSGSLMDLVPSIVSFAQRVSRSSSAASSTGAPTEAEIARMKAQREELRAMPTSPPIDV